MNGLTEEMTALKTGSSALEAERTTAMAHIADLKRLRDALEGDRQQKLSVIETMEADSARLRRQIEQLLARQNENRQLLEKARGKMKQVMTDRAETEASKTRA